MGGWNDGAWAWNLQWRRVLYEWENEELLRLKQLIEEKRPSREVEDVVYWKHSGHIYYPMKNIVAKMNESYTPTLSKPIVNIVWQKFIPPRAKLSVWLTNLEKLKTGDLLVEKGIIDSQEAVCLFCSLDMESNSHILFTCRLSWSAWMKILEWWGISGVLHRRCTNFNIEWFGLMKRKKTVEIFGVLS